MSMHYKADFEESKEELIQLMSEGYGRNRIAKAFGIHESKAQRWMKKATTALTEGQKEALQEQDDPVG